MPTDRHPSGWHRVWDWVVRHADYELTPLLAGLGLLAGATVLHLVAESWWWTALPGGALAVGTVSTWTIHPRRNCVVRRRTEERRWVVIMGCTAAAWLGAAWRTGPGVIPIWLFGLITLAAGILWWWHRRIRAKVSRRVDGWEHHAKEARLPRSQAISGEFDGERGYWLHLRLHGHTVDEVRRNLGRIAATLRARPGSVTVEAERGDASRCTVHVDETEPKEPVWRHRGQEGGRGRTAALSIVTPNDDDDVAEWEEDDGPRPRVLQPAKEPWFLQPGSQIVDAPRPQQLEAPQSDPLLDALRATPEGGVTVQELVDRGLAPRTTAFRRIKRLVADGSVVSLGEGRYRATTTSSGAPGLSAAAAQEAGGE